MIFSLEVNRVLHNGCEAYLAYVIDKSLFEITLDNVPVVCKFHDVFLKDFSDSLVHRELEFGIELLSGSALIYIPLYRVTPVKLKELKTQLQDLVDKGFI